MGQIVSYIYYFFRSTSFVHGTPSTTATTNLSIKRKRDPPLAAPPRRSRRRLLCLCPPAREHLHQDRPAKRGAAGDQPQVPADWLLHHLHRVVLQVGLGGRHARRRDRRLHTLVRDRWVDLSVHCCGLTYIYMVFLHKLSISRWIWSALLYMVNF